MKVALRIPRGASFLCGDGCYGWDVLMVKNAAGAL